MPAAAARCRIPQTAHKPSDSIPNTPVRAKDTRSGGAGGPQRQNVINDKEMSYVAKPENLQNIRILPLPSANFGVNIDELALTGKLTGLSCAPRPPERQELLGRFARFLKKCLPKRALATCCIANLRSHFVGVHVSFQRREPLTGNFKPI